MIPKILFQTSRDSPDPLVVSTVQSWLTPEWTYIHFKDEDILQFFKDYPHPEFPRVSEIFNALTIGAHKADFFRVYHMLVKGGVFIDSDSMMFVSIEEITRNYSFFTVLSGPVPGAVFNGLMGSTQGHPIVYEAVKYIYNTNPIIFNENYFLLCVNIYNTIHSGNYDNIKLYVEKTVVPDYSFGSFDEDKLLLCHYPYTKNIPRDCLISPHGGGDYDKAIRYILNNNIEGACVECGVEKGDVEVMWINELQKYNQVRDIYLFDTFSGLTPPDERDYGLLNGWSAQDVKNCWSQNHIDNKTNGWCYCPLADVKSRLLNTNYPEDKLHFIVGDVEDTLEDVKNIPEKIAILRLDTDWYKSTKIELEKLYDNVVPGGLIIMDDYYYWAGQRKAVDEFFTNLGVKYEVIQCSDKTGYIIKNSIKTDIQIYDWAHKIRLGNAHDGGYVIADDVGSYDCYLSCGVACDESFSRDFINKFSMNETNSFAFDGTIDAYPWNCTTNISFIRKNISDTCDDMNTDLQYYLERHKDVFLKMDIEGGEYKWLACTSHLKNIKQMVIEFHNVWNTKVANECLEKIAETHVIVHAHGNNYGDIVNNLPNVIELTYVRRDVAESWSLNTTCLPIAGLDFSNNPRVNDIFLGSQPFQHPRIAIWIEDNWAFGRIARALSKYANVDVYDWRSCESTSKLWNEGWKYYDHIISTSIILNVDFIPQDAFKKIIVHVHHGEFDDPYFRELDKIREDVRYGAVCKKAVEDMKLKGYPDPRWVPWGVDTDMFPVKYSVSSPIRRIGLIASDTLTDSQYAKNKGYAMFQEICDAVGAEAVYIRGKPEGQIYDDIDLLICCSRVEGGPLGIFEASASGLPVMSTPVGNMKDIDGLVLFTNVQEAVQQIRVWNDDITSLQEYIESITREIRTNWSMKVCVERFMSTL
jgi:glycosyltransferase involved in cell wall biosynthesis